MENALEKEARDALHDLAAGGDGGHRGGRRELSISCGCKNDGIAHHRSDTAIFISISIYGRGDYLVSFSSAAAAAGAVVTSVAGTTL